MQYCSVVGVTLQTQLVHCGGSIASGALLLLRCSQNLLPVPPHCGQLPEYEFIGLRLSKASYQPGEQSGCDDDCCDGHQCEQKTERATTGRAGNLQTPEGDAGDHRVLV